MLSHALKLDDIKSLFKNNNVKHIIKIIKPSVFIVMFIEYKCGNTLTNRSNFYQMILTVSENNYSLPSLI